MIDTLMQLTFWHWLIIGAILLTLEVLFGSSGFLLWMGIAAGLVGLMLWLMPGIVWPIQLLCFAALSLLAVIGWRVYLKKHPIKTDSPTLNRRGEQYVGRIFTLDAPVQNGMGKIRVDDSSWRIRCVDTPPGKRVKITGVDGVILIAEPLQE